MTGELRKVFVSHDTDDAVLAGHLQTLIKESSGGFIEPFCSSDVSGDNGILYGDDWCARLIEELRSARVVLSLLTERSIRRPWVLFEAGFARGQRKDIIGLLVNITPESLQTSPFHGEQNAACNTAALEKLVRELIRKAGGKPERELVSGKVGGFVERLGEYLEGCQAGTERLPAPGADPVLDRLEAFLFGEAQITTAMRWLCASSICLRDMPWLELPAQELYRALRDDAKNAEHVRTAVTEARRAVKANEVLGGADTARVSSLLLEFLRQFARNRGG